MVRFKKLAAVLLSAVMLVCCFTVQASAKSVYDKAVKLSPMEIVSGDFSEVEDRMFFYKVVVTDSGKIKIHCGDYWWHDSPSISITDSKGNSIVDLDIMGRRLETDYKLPKKGTYYIRVQDGGHKAWFKELYYTFVPDHTPTISLALNAKVGDEFDFSALTSNYKGKVTMKTTDSKVADVDRNIVTCKKAGKAKIRAYMNNGDYAEITLIVKKK